MNKLYLPEPVHISLLVVHDRAHHPSQVVGHYIQGEVRVRTEHYTRFESFPSLVILSHHYKRTCP